MIGDLRSGGLLDPFDCSGQFAFGKRVGDEFVGPLAQQLVQGGRCDVLGNEDHVDLAGFGLGDDFQSDMFFERKLSHTRSMSD